MVRWTPFRYPPLSGDPSRCPWPTASPPGQEALGQLMARELRERERFHQQYGPGPFGYRYTSQWLVAGMRGKFQLQNISEEYGAFFYVKSNSGFFMIKNEIKVEIHDIWHSLFVVEIMKACSYLHAAPQVQCTSS